MTQQPTDDELERLLATEGRAHETAAVRRSFPKGMEPSVKFDAKGNGTVSVNVPAGQVPQWNELLTEAGFTDVIDVLEVTGVRAWQRYDGEWLRHMTARVRRRRHAEDQSDVEELIATLGAREPQPVPLDAGDPLALVLCLSDWQLGKRDGDGTRGVVKRARRAFDLAADRIRRLRAQGTPVSRLVIAGLGDLVEGCKGFYPAQTFTVELNRRQQVKVARRLWVEGVAGLAPLVPSVVVVVIPGNHGENRDDSGAYTDTGDNDDVACVEQAAEVIQATQGHDHVSFVIPRDELTVTLDVYGTVVAFAHGHQARRGSTVEAKLINWWKDLTYARHPVGGADVLVTGHYHHLAVKADGGRTWLQCPTIDGGSKWWEDRGGCPSVPGTLSFLVSPDRGWHGLEVLA